MLVLEHNLDIIVLPTTSQILEWKVVNVEVKSLQKELKNNSQIWQRSHRQIPEIGAAGSRDAVKQSA